jgi:ankyrin repeat protein
VLRGGLSRDVSETLKCLTQGSLSDFIENQNFSSLHRIVLKLSLQDLEEEILQNADDIDVPDAMGRTALE